MSSGYSVDTRRAPSGPVATRARSSTDETVELVGTASTTWIGLAVDFEYSSTPSEVTSLPRSSTQSRPVMPTSNKPLATYSGISCGRRIRTSATRGSSMAAR